MGHSEYDQFGFC